MSDSDEENHGHAHDHGHVESRIFLNKPDEEVYKNLSKLFLKLEEKELPVKNAGFYRTRVDYFRGKDFVQTIEKNLNTFKEEIKNFTKTQQDNQTAKDIAQWFYRV